MKNIKIIQQGAEAKIFLNEKENLIIKARIPKSYRIPEIDNTIRKRRTKSETKLLTKASEIINSPMPLTPSNESQIIMPFINGKKLSQHLDKFTLKEQKQIMKSLGESIAKLHKAEIIHGDLTTSNMILVEENIEKINFEKQLLELKKLKFPIKDYAIFGSGPLGIRGIRKCRDIDIIVNENIWQEYKKRQDWEFKITKNRIEHLSKGNIELWHNWLPWYSKVNNFIKNAEIIEGFPFVKLKYVVEWKTKFGREKDKQDILLIKNYLNQKEVITNKNKSRDAKQAGEKENENNSKNKKIFFIDFGLGYISRKTEDKAVDLHLLKQALEAKHFKHWKELFEEVSKSYEKTLGKEEAKKVFERITAVERRGRYRH